MTMVEGTYANGRVELKECPPEIKRARVLVIFMDEPAQGAEPQFLEYGKYAGVVFNEEDFKAAEWRGDPAELDAA